MNETNSFPREQSIKLSLRLKSDAVITRISGRSSRLETTLWLLTLAMVARLTILIRQRAFDDYQVVDRMASFQIALVMASLLLVMLSGRWRSLWRTVARRSAGLMLLFYGFGAVSALWSPSPAFSLYRAFEYLSQILAIFAALSCCHPFRLAERRVLIVCAMSMALGMMAIIHSYGYTLSLKYWHTNQFTVPAVLLFTYSMGEYISGQRQDKKWLMGWAAVGLCGLLIGTSSASSISMLCGLAVAACITRNRTKAILGLSLIGFCLTMFAGATVFKKMIFAGKDEKKIENLSGRKFLWEGYINKFYNNPVLGEGYAITARTSTHMRATNTHNSAISVLLGTGIAGMAILIWSFGRFMQEVRLSIHLGRHGAVGCISALSAGLLNSLGVAFLGETWMMSSFSFICFIGFFTLHVLPTDRSL